MKNIAVRIGEHIDAIAETTWDAYGHSIMCNIRYIDVNPPRVPTLSEKLDRQFNIIEQSYILTGGFFSMALDPQKRIVDWSIYTNPNRWIRGERGFEEAVPATAHIDAEFDENGRAYTGEPTEFYEPIRGTFYLSWGEISTWYAIAPTLAIGVANDNTLAQIRLDGLHVQTGNQQVEGLWSRLRHRFGF
ncbi:hypothetical protein [Paraburkholderia adhaesiva]|uniref:hypothetical protein n=1 Tax=Paraburkholderia adhaesiva TaxID=2883244 RepID=UPI001F1B0DF6|nr:hypothetical protein [Paraburkholderia adhaesiva]